MSSITDIADGSLFCIFYHFLFGSVKMRFGDDLKLKRKEKQPTVEGKIKIIIAQHERKVMEKKKKITA